MNRGGRILSPEKRGGGWSCRGRVWAQWPGADSGAGWWRGRSGGVGVRWGGAVTGEGVVAGVGFVRRRGVAGRREEGGGAQGARGAAAPERGPGRAPPGPRRAGAAMWARGRRANRAMTCGGGGRTGHVRPAEIRPAAADGVDLGFHERGTENFGGGPIYRHRGS